MIEGCIIEALISIVAVGALLLLMEEMIDKAVYGKNLSDEEIKPFYEAARNEGKLNSYDFEIISFGSSYFFGLRSRMFSQSWYLHEIGRLPKKSKYHQKLNELRQNLIKKIYERT